jgi:hypothetical protein
MGTDDPRLHTEQGRELIVTGDLEQFKGLMDVEAALSQDLTFRRLGRLYLTLFGPIVHGASILWLVAATVNQFCLQTATARAR